MLFDREQAIKAVAEVLYAMDFFTPRKATARDVVDALAALRVVIDDAMVQRAAAAMTDRPCECSALLSKDTLARRERCPAHNPNVVWPLPGDTAYERARAALEAALTPPADGPGQREETTR